MAAPSLKTFLVVIGLLAAAVVSWRLSVDVEWRSDEFRLNFDAEGNGRLRL